MRRHGKWLWLFTVGLLACAGRPTYALPQFARQYGVACQTCHSIPPRLNEFGQAFKANNFNWPGGSPAASAKGLKGLPFSSVAEFSFEDNRSEGKSSTQFRSLQLFFAGGFHTGRQRAGGYMASVVAATTEEGEKGGNMEKAFLAYPISGARGQWTLGAGQFAAVMYQWDHNQLVHDPPLALGADFDDYSLGEPRLGVRVDYFDHRGQGSADGHYLTLGVPLRGQLCLNRDAQVGSPRGLFAHAFRRHGQNTLGAFGYAHAGSHLGGVIATRALHSNLYLLGIGALGSDGGSTHRLSFEAEYVAGPRIALTGRVDVTDGDEGGMGEVAAVTYYPFKQPVLRLTIETIQRKGNRSLELIARGQF